MRYSTVSDLRVKDVLLAIEPHPFWSPERSSVIHCPLPSLQKRNMDASLPCNCLSLEPYHISLTLSLLSFPLQILELVLPSLLLFPWLTLCPHQMSSQSPPHPHSLCSPSTDRGQALHTPCAAQGCRKEHPLQERKAKRERLLTTWAGPHTPASSTSLAQALNDFQTQDRDRLSSGDSLVGGTVQCPRIWW